MHVILDSPTATEEPIFPGPALALFPLPYIGWVFRLLPSRL